MRVTQLINLAEGPYDFGDLQPFVFDPYEHENHEFDESFKEGDILACPFPSFSIEMDGGHPIVGHTELSKNGTEVTLLCLYCKEISPGNYDLIALFRFSKDGEEKLMGVNVDADEGRAELMPFVVSMLGKLHGSDTGTLRGSGRAKYRDSRGRKQMFKPRHVIYIGSQKKVGDRTTEGAAIDWSHEWSVRAHWRRLGNRFSCGVGRDGERNVKGYTWIDNYHKGSGPLVEKIRKVCR